MDDLILETKADLPVRLIENRILLVRAEKVMLDEDLAELYQVPTKRLYYRTVFDVNVGGRSIIEAWTDGWPANSYVVYSLGELERFHRTYYGIPAPPAPATLPASGIP